MEQQRRNADSKKMRTIGWMRWLVAAVIVFQSSAAVGAQLNPPDTWTAVPVPRRTSSGR